MIKQILEKIEAYHIIIIHRHQRPDPDALGSQVGLAELIRHNYPEKIVKVTGTDVPNLSWLAQMDQVADQDYEAALVIVTDTANRPRIDDDRYDQGQYLIKIDHHPNEDPYGDICYVDTTASSASEIITQLALSFDWQLSDTAARLLYTGIVGDTGRFLYPATTSRTLEIAAHLRTYEFDFAAISRQMDSFSLPIAKLQSYVFDQLQMDANGVAYVTLTQETLKAFGLTDADTAAIVGSPGKIDCVQTWAIFVEQPEGHYRVRLRSKEKVINQIAKLHDGGGHPLASGANSYSLAENQTIYQELQALFQEKETKTLSKD
ncbi:DHH family phosphoesterase [Streptococcus cuniculipharyngis]|uniref:Bifunctional oligoribonuclease/PAP phosphatase NrnA n=1 Tax=Streptococcus cuniculipharyngis TaxID=1562651 RepID=A0A5C5SGJ6_9STRE|nr:bifunctional oligoribonuclease/PAP phosphatase NrnA [Streptococcus cuniculipharyngis]TWS99031.1 bifunctional oligoribonuclease/PAP phosphatase NrnA [Streptococcus cuniculipharyngis]